MADIWKGYRNGKGCLKVGDEFILPGGEVTQNHQNKMDADVLKKLKKDKFIVSGNADTVKPVKSPSTEKGKKKEEAKK
jgi:hypothetical protein